jgi:aryl-alcohol dehydrogenase-like predicted oxidoreductase
MLEPVWDGCLRADTRWHEATQTPLLAWSAQARGFFAGRADDAEMRASWTSPPNVERRRRARELAGRYGVAPVSLALAWVLARPFPVHAVVGPRDRYELDECLAALGLLLSADELRWLELPAGTQASSTTGSNPP